jgi:hypothetical protein
LASGGSRGVHYLRGLWGALPKNVILQLNFFVLFFQVTMLFIECNISFLCESMLLLLFGQGLAQGSHLTSL